MPCVGVELEDFESAHRLNLEERRERIIDMAPMPIYVKDEDLRYVFANAQADDLGRTGERRAAGPHRRGDHEPLRLWPSPAP